MNPHYTGPLHSVLMNLMLRRKRLQAKAFLMLSLLMLPLGAVHAVDGNLSAIVGADTNNDGVRDDVGQYIQQRWRDPQLRFWATEAARGTQAYLASDGNRFALHRAHAFLERARRCLNESHDAQKANQIINAVLNVQLDTYARKLRYKEAVDAWLHKVSREDLPSQPDDNWDSSCKRADGTLYVEAGTQGVDSPALQDEETLPPPNFFITKAKPRSGTGVGTAASVDITPLVPLPTEGFDSPTAAEQASGNQAPAIGRWTTYSPRKPNPKYFSSSQATQPGGRSTALPVRKLKQGETAQIAGQAARPKPYKPSPITAAAPKPKPAARPVTRPAVRPAQPRVPAALQDLAPYIQTIERR